MELEDAMEQERKAHTAAVTRLEGQSRALEGKARSYADQGEAALLSKCFRPPWPSQVGETGWVLSGDILSWYLSMMISAVTQGQSVHLASKRSWVQSPTSVVGGSWVESARKALSQRSWTPTVSQGRQYWP